MVRVSSGSGYAITTAVMQVCHFGLCARVTLHCVDRPFFLQLLLLALDSGVSPATISSLESPVYTGTAVHTFTLTPTAIVFAISPNVHVGEEEKPLKKP